MGRPKKTINPYEGNNSEENELLNGGEGAENMGLEHETEGNGGEGGDDNTARKPEGDGGEEGVGNTTQKTEGNESPEEEENKKEEAKNVGPEVNASVQNLLRIFNGYDELYISKVGGVFPKGNVPGYVKDAVLYKNPFFKKKH